MVAGFGTRTIIQAIYFVFLARTLGAKEYGAFAAVVALMSLLAPFSSWGSGNILIKHVACRPERFREFWGAALAATLLSGSGLTLLGIGLVTPLFGPDKAFVLGLPIALGDLLGIRLADVAGQAFQAVEQLRATAVIWAAVTLTRLLGLTVLYFLPVPKTASTWAWAYGASGFVLGLICVLWVGWRLGWGPLHLRPLRGEGREGFYFAVSLSSQGAYNDLDKTLLSRFVSDAVAGQYAAAYRILDVAFIPIRAILYATYPRFFQEGRQGLQGTLKFALRLVPIAFLLAIGSSLLLMVLAPLVPVILGQEFSQVPLILYWLVPVLLFRSLHYFAADAFTGAGFQGLRTAFQLGVAIFNLGLNLVLIPWWSWQGAAVASWLSDGGLALSLWGTLYAKVKRVTR